jgi:hypothetical protein
MAYMSSEKSGGQTLRDHYGLPKPQNQFSARQRRAALAGGS